jgi:hypothetical protein
MPAFVNTEHLYTAEASPAGSPSESERLDVATDQAIAACAGQQFVEWLEADLHTGRHGEAAAPARAWGVAERLHSARYESRLRP